MVSGKLYYDLLKAREDQKKDDVALVRLEQLYPFPAAELTTRVRPLRAVRGDRVGPGGAAQHGRLALRPRAVPGRRMRDRGACRATSAARRARARRRVAQGPRGGAGSDRGGSAGRGRGDPGRGAAGGAGRRRSKSGGALALIRDGRSRPPLQPPSRVAAATQRRLALRSASSCGWRPRFAAGGERGCSECRVPRSAAPRPPCAPGARDRTRCSRRGGRPARRGSSPPSARAA